MLRILDIYESLSAHFWLQFLHNEIISVRFIFCQIMQDGASIITELFIITHHTMSVARTQSQQSVDSLNSSDLFSVESSFQSTQSLDSISSSKLNSKHFECENLQNNNFQSPKQLPRFNQQKRQSDQFPFSQQPFVGFVGLGKNKSIHINQSKLKQAKKFMDLDDSQPFIGTSNPFNKKQLSSKSDSDSEGTQSIGDNKSIQNTNECEQQKPQQFPDFSLGFKSLGTGTMIKISQQASNKVKMLFSQFDIQQTKESKPKQTKSKISKDKERQSIKFTNFIKTEKVKHNPKQLANLKIQKKTAVNEDKKLIDGMIVKLGQKYKSIRLNDMPKVGVESAKKFSDYWQKYDHKPQKHTKGECEVSWCYFCQKYKEKVIEISKQFIQEEAEGCLKMQQSTRTRIPKLIQLIIFKLSRIQYFDSSIKNKRVNANNILLQLYKKCMFYEKQRQGPLESSISSVMASRGKNSGKQLNLVIVNIAHNKQMGMHFVELSDGWSCVMAVLASNNDLVAFISSKLVVGTKIQIVNWSIHPLCNIIQHHPDQRVSSSSLNCIQISYNNSMPSPYFSKLGWPSQLFYKAVPRCRETGGSVPLVQGIVVRMFSIKSGKNTVSNYVQLLLREGQCMLMKVGLAQQISLVELFRLYYCYHFMRIKKVSKTMLQFVGSSKYYEVNDADRMDKVRELLKNRLLNTTQPQTNQQSSNSYINNLTNNINSNTIQFNKKLYVDILTKSDSFTIGDTKIHIEEKIEQTTPVLLQQYVISNAADGLVVTKGDRGSCLRRIPKIYDNIHYTLL